MNFPPEMIHDGPYVTHDQMGKPYTPERVRAAAQRHFDYGWTPQPQFWPMPLLKIYREAYDNARIAARRGPLPERCWRNFVERFNPEMFPKYPNDHKDEEN